MEEIKLIEDSAPKTERREDCPCKRVRCSRHGDCAACREHHSSDKMSAVSCERPTREEKRRLRKKQA